MTKIILGGALASDGRDIEAHGFEHEGTFIVDPTVSECGRFEVDPMTYYHLTHDEVIRLNSLNSGLDLL